MGNMGNMGMGPPRPSPLMEAAAMLAAILAAMLGAVAMAACSTTCGSLCLEEGVLACEDPSLRGLTGGLSLCFFSLGPFSRGDRSPFIGELG